jgi:hypothetical protein
MILSAILRSDRAIVGALDPPIGRRSEFGRVTGRIGRTTFEFVGEIVKETAHFARKWVTLKQMFD